VDVCAFTDFADFVFEDCEEMPGSDFVEMVIQFRGSKMATVKDIVDLRKFIFKQVGELQDKVTGQHHAFSAKNSPIPHRDNSKLHTRASSHVSCA